MWVLQHFHVISDRGKWSLQLRRYVGGSNLRDLSRSLSVTCSGEKERARAKEAVFKKILKKEGNLW